MTDQRQRARIAAFGDGADVPAHGDPRVEVGGLDEQQAALAVFGGDFRDQGLVDVARDGLIQRRGVGERVLRERGGDENRGAKMLWGVELV